MTNIKIHVRELDRGFVLEWNTWDDLENSEPSDYLWHMAIASENELADVLSKLAEFTEEDFTSDGVTLSV